MKVIMSLFSAIFSTLKQEGNFVNQKAVRHSPQLRCFVLLLLVLVIILTGCATTNKIKLASPSTQKDELSQFSKQAVSTPYQTYAGERLSRNKTATIAVNSNMMATDKEGIGIHSLSINNYKIDFMKDIDNRPKYYQFEILPGQNSLETMVKWFYKPESYDYIGTAKLTFNAKVGATYFLLICKKNHLFILWNSLKILSMKTFY